MYKTKFWNQDGNSLSIYPKNTTVHWCGTDNLTAFNKNKPTGYSEDSISYSFNDLGFRCENYHEGNNYILVSGCSHTMGIGIPYEHTWPAQLQQEFFPDFKIYNAAKGAASNDYIVRSVYQLLPIVKPKIVMVAWTHRPRYELVSYGVVQAMLPTSLNFSKEHVDESFQNYRFDKNQIFLKLLCKQHNIILVNMEWEEIVKEGSQDHYDVGRDQQHGGRKFNKFVSTQFYKKYQNLVEHLQ